MCDAEVFVLSVLTILISTKHIIKKYKCKYQSALFGIIGAVWEMFWYLLFISLSSNIFFLDVSFKYGKEGQLYCEVDAYPEASIKWYHNDSLVKDSNYLEVIPDDNTIIIKSMTLNTTGEYSCEISNSIEKKTYRAFVDIDIGNY